MTIEDILVIVTASLAGGGPGLGDVDGPSSATDNALVRFDGTGGSSVQNSVAVLTDAGAASGFVSVAATTFTGDIVNTISAALDLRVGGVSVINIGAANLVFNPTGGYFLRANGTPIAFFSASTHYLAFPTAIGAAAAPNAHAVLDLVSTSRGFIPPRLTTEQRDAITWVAGDEAAEIYNLTLKKKQVWNGAAWETVTSL